MLQICKNGEGMEFKVKITKEGVIVNGRLFDWNNFSQELAEFIQDIWNEVTPKTNEPTS